MIFDTELSAISTEFPFIEACIAWENEHLDVNNNPAINIEEVKLNKLLINKATLPLWLDYAQIAVNNPENRVQLDLLGHSNEPVLLLKPDNSEQLFIFKFKKYETGEGIFYGIDQKYLIEKMLNLWLLNNIKQKISQINEPENFIQICKNQIVKIDWLNNELTTKNLELEKFYTSLFSYFLREIIQPGTTISLSDSTLSYLKDSEFNFSEIETMAIESYKIALALSPHSNDIRIKKYFLSEPKQKPENPEPKQSPNKLLKTKLPDTLPELLKPEVVEKPQLIAPPITNTRPGDEKLGKTILLLDRYELAVKKLIESKLPVMGKNIANVCTPKISAPALTDSINKHKDRIIECLKIYPDNWPLLKSNYQPIQKLSY